MVIEIRTAASLTLSQLITTFLISRRQLSPDTQRYYETCLKNFLWYAQKEGWPEEASLIGRDHIRQFLDYVRQSKNRWGYRDPTRSCRYPASSGTINHYGRVVKRLFHWASDEEDIVPDNGIWRLKLPRPNYRHIEPYTDGEVLAMLEGCEEEFHASSRFLGSRNQAIISMFADTGMRLSELASNKPPGIANSMGRDNNLCLPVRALDAGPTILVPIQVPTAAGACFELPFHCPSPQKRSGVTAPPLLLSILPQKS